MGDGPRLFESTIEEEPSGRLFESIIEEKPQERLFFSAVAVTLQTNRQYIPLRPATYNIFT